MTILSRKPLSEADIENVEKIFRESECPHESLAASFPRYSGLIGDVIFFDDADIHDYVCKEAFGHVYP